MENLSIKILDALFDLCDGENYVILDQEDILASYPEAQLDADELAEILESLTVEGFIDLKYADNTEYCVAMRTKGRTLIKQSREKLQHILQENADVIEGESVTSSETSDAPSAQSAPAKKPQRPRRPVISSSDSDPDSSSERYAPVSPHTEKASSRLEEYKPHETEEELEKKEKARNTRAFLAALLGALAGSLIMDLIFLVIILVKLGG